MGCVSLRFASSSRIASSVMPGRASNSSDAARKNSSGAGGIDVAIAVRVFARRRGGDRRRARRTHRRCARAARSRRRTRRRSSPARRPACPGMPARNSAGARPHLMHWRASRAQGTPASQVSVVSLTRSRRVRPLCVSMTTPRMPPSRTSRLLPSPSQNSGVPSGSVREKREQVGAVARTEEHVRRAADVPRRVPRHRLVALHARLELGVDHERCRRS